MPWWIVWLVGALLEMAADRRPAGPIVDEFAARFVFFYSGYVFAPLIFRFAAWVIGHAAAGLGFLAVWAIVNGVAVFGGFSELPGVSLALGIVGATAVVCLSALLSKTDWSWRRSATAAGTRSSSTSPSSCRWRPRVRCF